MSQPCLRAITWSATLCAALWPSAFVTAAENGGSIYPGGVETFNAANVPPPGFYLLAYLQDYRADRLVDGRGRQVPVPGFSVHARALTLHPVWSTAVTWGDGTLMGHAILPLVDLQASAAGQSQRHQGLADVTAGLGWVRHDGPNRHTLVGLDVVLPTGEYDQGGLANLGRNHAAVQPYLSYTRLEAEGLNADVKLTLSLNGRNRTTDYRSGHEVFADYAAGWAVAPGWTLGAAGYWREQLVDDRQGGQALDDSRSRTFAIGPAFRYESPSHWFISAKWQKEVFARQSTRGAALWVKTVVPF
jgi:hypothetical protein